MTKQTAAEQLHEATRKREEFRRNWERNRNTDLTALLAVCLPRLFPIDRYGLFVVSADERSVWLEAGTGVTERAIMVDVETSRVGAAIRNDQTLADRSLAAVTGSHQAVGSSIGYAPVSALTTPIHAPGTGRPIGALQILNGEQEIDWTPEHMRTLESIAHSIAATVETIHRDQAMVEELQTLDKRIQELDREETAIRGSHMLRTFAPAEPLPSGGFLHGRYQNTMYPPFIDTRANEDLAASWDCDGNDVFICTHQKVGTHLAKKFVVELLRTALEGTENIYQTSDIGHGTMPWPEVSVSQHGRAWIDAHIARTYNVPRAWYVHCSYNDLPIRRIHPGAKFLVVYRDPKAVAVSQYYFWKRHPLLQVPETLGMDAFVEQFLDGDLYFGDYHQHVRSWLERGDDRIRRGNILALSYEDMVERKPEVARALADFLVPGHDFSEDQLDRIAASTDFNTMKAEVTANPQSFHLNPKVYFRSGTTRDWETQLSALSIAAIDEKSRRVWNGNTDSPPDFSQVTTLAG